MDIEWHDNALHDRRQWLGDLQPRRRETDDADYDADYVFDWGPACDEAIAARRASDPAFDAVFAVAEDNGIAIVPAYGDRGNESAPHTLMEMAYTCDDVDWVLVARRGSHADYTADLLATRLAPYRFECHNTPRWCIFVTHHA